MTWLTPMIGGIAAAVAIPTLLILYFLKLRRRDVEVSTTLLWKKSIQDLQANAPFQKLRRNILLLLQLLALAAALLALAQPQIRADTATGKRHVILIDRSASMSALDGDPDLAPNAEGQRTRLAQAKRKAIELVDSLREPSLLSGSDRGDQAMVIAFDSAGEVRQNFTASKADLKRAIEAIEPSDAPSSIADAFKLAKAYVPKAVVEGLGFVPVGDPAVIHIVSDGRLPDADAVAPDPGEKGDRVVYHAIGGESTPNIGVTALRADRAFDNPGKLTIFVGVQSSDRVARTVDVELSIDRAIASIQRVSLPASTAPAGATAGATSDEGPVAAKDWEPRGGGVVFSLDRPQGGIAAVRLRNTDTGSALDAMPVDDQAFVVIPPARRLSVALVTDGNLFLRGALEGMNLSRLSIMPLDALQRMMNGEQVEGLGMGDFDVFVIDRRLPQVVREGAPGGMASGLPPGRVLVLGAVPPPPMGLIDDGPGEPAVMVDWSRDHRALKYAGLGELIIAKSRKVEIAPDSPVTVLARDQHGPAIVEATNDTTRALIVPFDIAESDWPLKPGFVLFLASALPYLADDGGQGVGRVIQPGQTLSERLPLGAQSVRVAPPDNALPPQDLFPAADGRIAFGPVRQTGIYTVSWTGPATGTDILLDDRVRRAVAVNLVDAGESQIETRPALAIATGVVEAEGRGERQSTQNLWPWLLLAALGVVMLEWFVYNRKVHV